MPLKLKCFTWLVYFDKILTWNNLLKRGFVGPGVCSLCFNDEESADHLFGTCSYFLRVWLHLERHFGFQFPWGNVGFKTNYLHWLEYRSGFTSLVSFTIWGV